MAVPLQAPLAGYTYPFPYTRYEVFTAYESMPYSTVGKLFFDDPVTPARYYCTATVVNALNLSTVWTAGHCINTGGNQGRAGSYYKNHFFVPAQKDGFNAFGGWFARQIYSLNAWINNGEYEYDLGAVVLAPNTAGIHVQDLTGAHGILFNSARVRHWHSFGYPGEPSPPFNGMRMIICTASHAVDDSPDNPAAPPTIGIGCDMAQGSSGGCWVVDFKAPGGQCNSVNSYKYTNPSQPEAMYGPYHGSAAQDLFNVAGTT